MKDVLWHDRPTYMLDVTDGENDPTFLSKHQGLCVIGCCSLVNTPNFYTYIFHRSLPRCPAEGAYKPQPQLYFDKFLMGCRRWLYGRP